MLRILDVNFNRSREALRVLEEIARFAVEDRPLTERCKQLRHRVTLAGQSGGLSAARDVAGDVGTTVRTEREESRRDLADVAGAASSRLGEALRVLEEVLKIDDPAAAAEIERCRYLAYDLARDVLVRLARRAPHTWRLCVLLTESLCAGRSWREVAEAILLGGADVIQLREPELSARELLHRARELRAMTQGRAAMVVNDRPDVAVLARACGVHVGQHDLPVREVRRIVGAQMIIGVSTSRMSEAVAALDDGADYCGVGPMFATTTKVKDRIAGPQWLREYASWGRLPHLAIGGITHERLEALQGTGLQAVAVCGAVLGAPDPAEAVRALRAAVERASEANMAAAQVAGEAEA